MDLNQRLDPLEWNTCEPQVELPFRSSGSSQKQSDAYVTRAEMQEFKRGICELMHLFLEFYLTTAIELDAPYIDVHLN